MANTREDLTKDQLVEYKEIILSKLKFGVARSLGTTIADSMKLELNPDIEALTLQEQVTGYVLANKIADDTETVFAKSEHYFSWWQMFKNDKMPKWFTKRYPVRHYTQHQRIDVKFERYATYPLANMAVDQSEYLKIHLGGRPVIRDIITETQHG